MNLKDLVPPLELCQKIPEGEFEDAAFAWHYTDMVGFVCRTSGCEQVSGKEWQIVPSNASRIIRARKRGEQILPAPTLQEIMEELTELQDAFRVEFEDGKTMWMVADSGYEDNAATAALKAYFREKGIE